MINTEGKLVLSQNLLIYSFVKLRFFFYEIVITGNSRVYTAGKFSQKK